MGVDLRSRSPRRGKSEPRYHLFRPGYATEFEVSASKDRDTWTSLGIFRDQKGGRVEIRPEGALHARFLRIRAFKPDGPGQPGGQMSIAEVEVYEE